MCESNICLQHTQMNVENWFFIHGFIVAALKTGTLEINFNLII